MLVLRAMIAGSLAIFTAMADLVVENLALRQQLTVPGCKAGLPRL